ncbi:MAG TPA: hypothetical protein VHC69_22325 [Polyangiaceae bacterium]|nr:hypothetical protein [Polyangiaceae bacterium]
MPAVLTFGRRAIDFAVFVLAVYALAFVPLGRQTGLQHLRAILQTKAARDAGHELRLAAQRLGRRLLGDDAPLAPRAKAGAPALPRHATSNAAIAAAGFEGPDASAGAP